MDSKKRNLIGNSFPTDDSNMKRYRESDGMGNLTSKLTVPKQDFAKIIGKGGHVISKLRSTYGIDLKGVDVDEDQRLVSIVGKFNNVVEGFDAIAEILYTSYSTRMQQNSQPTQGDHFSISLMIDNDMSGKIMGAKGSMINTLRTNSGVTQAKLMKDVQTISGQPMRALVVEGSLLAVRRMHFLILRVLTDTGMGGGGGGDVMVGGLDPTIRHLGGGGGGGSPMAPQTQSLPVLPLESLGVRGVHVDAVRQLADLRNYLSVYSLDLLVVEAGLMQQQLQQQHQQLSAGSLPIAIPGNMAQHSQQPMMLYNNTNGGGMGQTTTPTRVNGGGGRSLPALDPNHKQAEFAIPVEKVGVIIGKGACVLRALRAEFGLYVVVDKEERGGMRNVIIRGEDEAAIFRAQDRIMKMITENSSAPNDDANSSVIASVM